MDHISSQPKTVAQAKQALLASASRIDYLAPIQQYPLRSLVMAFSIGVMMNTNRQTNPILSPRILALLMSTFRDMATSNRHK